MTRRYSKRTRERAALICQIAASNCDVQFWEAQAAIGASNISYRLACDAFSAVRPRVDWAEIRAEAECLIREGWPEVRRGR